MAHDQREARLRYQRQPRNVHYRTTRSIPHRGCDLLGASLVVVFCIALIWGFSWAYQMGYEACESYNAQEAASHA